jgi:hypothetical protein
VNADAITDTTAAASPVAPAMPARPARTVSRVRPAVALLALIALLGTLWSQSGRFRDDPYGLAKPPFKLEAAAWRSVLTVAATAEKSCPPSVPVVTLYVSASCRHCRAELQRWSNLLRSGVPQVKCIGFAVVATPPASQATTEWMPPELVPMLLWDHDRTIANALRVSLVPVTAYTTAKGVVVARAVGEASQQSTLLRLDDLRRAANDARGAP